MDCCSRLKPSPFFDALPAVARPEGGRFPLRRDFRELGSLRSLRPSLDSEGMAKLRCTCTFGSPRAPSLVTSACTESNKWESRSVGTPLEPRSPEGNFLCGILKNHPHIFPVAAAKQLEELATERDSAFARSERSEGSSESCLHGRIAEMKEQQCQIAIEEVMYLLIVHNFSKINVPLIPNLSKCTRNGRLEIWSSKDKELESIHGSEALEMVREHTSNILRWKGRSDTVMNWSTLEIKRLQLGRIYAASIMYGYFLKSVSLRHQLELNLPSTNGDQTIHKTFPMLQKNRREENLVAIGCSMDMTSSSPSSSFSRRKAEKLRSYMMGFDSKTLQLCAKLRSQEAANLIENHSLALFGGPEKNSDTIGKDEMVAISVSGLKRLVLEAVAFGSFLWDVEGYVDSVYRLKET